VVNKKLTVFSDQYEWGVQIAPQKKIQFTSVARPIGNI
jgi:hypothetical protein